jgi:hypothetical protein
MSDGLELPMVVKSAREKNRQFGLVLRLGPQASVAINADLGSALTPLAKRESP